MKLLRLVVSREPEILAAAIAIFAIACAFHLNNTALTIAGGSVAGIWALCVGSTIAGEVTLRKSSKDSIVSVVACGLILWIFLSVTIPNDSIRHVVQEYGLYVVIIVAIVLGLAYPKVVSPET